MSNNYRQLKLANGEELIADVLQWANDEDASIVIRSALKIVMTERDDGVRLYGLRPWMVYCEDMNHLLTVNADQIVGETTPSNPLLSQYTLTVAEFIKSYDEEQQDQEEDIDTIKLSTKLDSDGGSNVLSLFPKNKMH